MPREEGKVNYFYWDGKGYQLAVWDFGKEGMKFETRHPRNIDDVYGVPLPVKECRELGVMLCTGLGQPIHDLPQKLNEIIGKVLEGKKLTVKEIKKLKYAKKVLEEI